MPQKVSASVLFVIANLRLASGVSTGNWKTVATCELETVVIAVGVPVLPIHAITALHHDRVDAIKRRVAGPRRRLVPRAPDQITPRCRQREDRRRTRRRHPTGIFEPVYGQPVQLERARTR